jgi:hypothetical protein
MDIFVYSQLGQLQDRLVAVEAALEEIRKRLERLEADRVAPAPG